MTHNKYFVIELVQARSKMEEYYRRTGQAQIADVFGQPIENLTLKDIFVELRLVDSSVVEKEWREQSEYMDHLRLHNEKKNWRNIKLSHIFQKDDRHVLLDGIAGQGKTVLSNKLCSDWADGYIFQDSAFIFHFTARNLNLLYQGNPNREYSLYELVKHYYSPQLKGVNEEDFNSIIDRTLVVLDGLDEFSGLEELYEDQDCLMGFQKSMFELIKCREGHKILITGRPKSIWYVQTIYHEQIVTYRKIQTLGFNDDTILIFMNKFFGTEDSSPKLLQKINNHPHIRLMLKIPVILHMVCCIFKCFPGEEVAKTITEMYAYGSVTFLRHHSRATKRKKRVVNNELSHDDIDLLLIMASISHMMLERGVVVIDYKEILHFLHKYNIPEKFLESNEYLLVYDINGRRVVMYRHLTQQEFFAALHVVVEAIPLCDIKNNPSLHGVLHLASGLQGALLEDSKSSSFLITYISSIMQRVESKKLVSFSEKCDVINTSKSYVHDIFTECKVENDASIFNSSRVIGTECKVENDVLIFNSSRARGTSYTFLMCLFEYQNPSKELLVRFSGTQFQFADVSTLYSYMMLFALEECNKFNIKVGSIEVDCWHQKLSVRDVERMARCFMPQNVDQLQMPNCEMNDYHLCALASLIPLVKKVILRGNTFTDQGAMSVCNEILKVATKQTQLGLKTLNLRRCEIDDASLAVLSEVIPMIERVYLSNNSFTAVGLKDLVNAYTNCQHEKVLKTIILDGCLDDEKLLVLSELFVHMKEVDIEHNRFTSSGYKSLVNAINNSQHEIKLEAIYIGNGSNITSDDIMMMQEACPNIRFESSPY